MTVGVGRIVDLPRRLTDDEWERVVADLRETFDARGTVRAEGSTRMWSNGNLQIALEPTATGHRLQMRTVKGDSRGYVSGGLGMIAIGIFITIFKTLSGPVDMSMVAGLWTLTAVGLGMVAAGTLRLPSWARLRKKQMEEIAARTVDIAEGSRDNS